MEWSKKRILGNEIGFTYKAEDEQKLAHVLDSFGFKYQLQIQTNPPLYHYTLKPDGTVGVVELKNPLAAPATLAIIKHIIKLDPSASNR